MRANERRLETNKCPRRGYVILTSKNGQEIVKETSCKTWGCKSCKHKLSAMVRMRMEYGILELGSCVLITITYRVGQGSSLRDAESARKDMSQFWKMLRLQWPKKKMQWFRVTELTKQRQVHFHLIANKVSSQKTRCVRQPKWSKKWVHNGCQCDMHVLSRLWYSITGDTFIVDVMDVRYAAGAASYLGKYLMKAFEDREELERRGFARRYTTSRGWPAGRLRMQGTVDERWQTREFVGIPSVVLGERVLETQNRAIGQSVGTDLALALGERVSNRRTRSAINKLDRRIIRYDDDSGT